VGATKIVGTGDEETRASEGKIESDLNPSPVSVRFTNFVLLDISDLAWIAEYAGEQLNVKGAR
jgi:hypothetical protein